ncbi:MAG: GxxExxY protein [Flavobacteriia bacterium]|jgi:GxxExxY protein
MTENEISDKIRGAIFSVYNELGPGLLESTYERALVYELNLLDLTVKCQQILPLNYKSITIDNAYKLDILVENKVIIELKSVENLLDVHHKQLLTYLKVSNLKLGILVNFNSDDITQSIYRKVNKL